MPYRIIIADDHEMFRSGLKSLIDRDPCFEVVGEAQDGEELLDKLRSITCDCVVLDLSMPRMDGLQTLEWIGVKYPKIKTIILTMQKAPDHFGKALDAGAWGYILKNDAFEQLAQALKTVMKDKKFISPSMTGLLTRDMTLTPKESLRDRSCPGTLTRRENQILKYIANGSPNKHIALKLHISIRTVETHRLNLIRKLGIRNTAGLVKYALSQGLVDR